MEFDIQDAKALLEPCGVIDKYFTIDEYGVWPSAEFDAADKEGSNFGQWRPAQVFAGAPLTPDIQPRKTVARTPALPPKFNARQLAAFMVGGMGALVAYHYGEWDEGPDPDRLNDMPQSEDFARHAVKGAFDAYREAERIVGIQPLALYAKAKCAREAWNKANSEANIREGVSESIPGTDDSKDRRDRAKASIAALDAEMESTAAEYQKEHDKWLNKMVRELLKPAPAQTEALEQVPVVDLHSGGKMPPVEPASDGPPKRRSRTWRDVSETYLEQKYKELQCPTVKDFFRALLNKAGVEDDSPFDKGTWQNHGSLFARDVGEKVTIKMIEGYVTELRKKM